MRTFPPYLNKSLPLLGHVLEFQKDRNSLFQRGYEAHGSVFSIGLGPKKAAVLVDPELAAYFFKHTDKELNMDKPYGFLKEALGDVAFVADHATYLNQRPTLYAPFTREKMVRYISIMQEVVQKWLDNLPDEGRMNISEEMFPLVQDVAGYCFGGKVFMEEAGAEFWELFGVIGKSLDPLLPPKWPFPKFLRRNKARRRMTQILAPMLADRRKNPHLYQDGLQDIIQTPLKDGRLATDAEIQSIIVGIMFAGHETTAGQAGWTIIQLLQNPKYAARVQQEIEAKFPFGTDLDAKSMTNLPHIRWAVDETTRMHPSADLLIRVAEADLEIGGYTIPKGWPVFLGIDPQQHLESVFTDPRAYDPLRFSRERSEHKNAKCAISGFGGGIHKCIGMSFAQNEMLAIVALLFQQFELELTTQQPETVRDLGAARPGEAWVNFRRRKQDLASKMVGEDAGVLETPDFAGGLRSLSGADLTRRTQQASPEEVSAALAGGCPHFARAKGQVEGASQPK